MKTQNFSTDLFLSGNYPYMRYFSNFGMGFYFMKGEENLPNSLDKSWLSKTYCKTLLRPINLLEDSFKENIAGLLDAAYTQKKPDIVITALYNVLINSGQRHHKIDEFFFKHFVQDYLFSNEAITSITS